MKTLLGMAWRSLWSRPWISGLTVLSILLGTALVSTVLTLHRESKASFDRDLKTFDLVVGGKGSPLQMILSTMYHMDIPTANIPLSTYHELAANRAIRDAMPMGLGDNYEGFWIIGTDDAFWNITDRKTKAPLFPIAEGRKFTEPFEAVVGAEVAAETGLRIGDTFVGTHGLVGGPALGDDGHDNFPYTVVGLLAQTDLTIDKGIYTPMESVWRVHEPADSDPVATAAAKPREITAALLRLRSPGSRWRIMASVNDNAGTGAMAVAPIEQMYRLNAILLTPLQKLLLAIAGLVVLVASLAVLSTLLQASEARRRDRAVLRTLGAHPSELFVLVLAEALLLVVLGVLLGFLLAHGGLALASDTLQQRTGLRIHGLSFGLREALAIATILGVGLLAGLIPAALNYRRSPVRDLKES